MKIAFDLRRIVNAGIGRYMSCLVTAIVEQAPQHQYLFIMAPGTESLLPCVNSGQVVLSSAAYYSFTEQFTISSILKKHNVDIFHALHFVVPIIKVCPTVVTIHDAIHFVYPQDLPSWKGRVYAKAMMTAAAHIADRVLTVSEYSKTDIVHYLHVDSNKVTVTHAMLDKQFLKTSNSILISETKKKFGITGDYLLYAGIFKERKNHVGLLKAFSVLRASETNIQLVIAGSLGYGKEILKRKAIELGIERDVIFPGFVPDENLLELYTAAKTYVCPSLYEGFGQTLIEAMACGTPVVSHYGSCLPEVCGDAALFVNANDPVEFAKKIRRSIEDANLRSMLIQKGYKNIERFNANEVAKLTLKVYDNVKEKCK